MFQNHFPSSPIQPIILLSLFTVPDFVPNPNADKFPLVEFIQKHKLSQAEVFLLLRLSALDLQRIMVAGNYQVNTLLEKGQIIGKRAELLSILIDRKSA